LLRTKKYAFPITDVYLRELQEAEKREQEREAERKRLKEEREKEGNTEGVLEENAAVIEQRTAIDVASAPDADMDTPDVPVRFMEKKRLDWKDKTCMYFLHYIRFYLNSTLIRPCTANYGW
jgi:tRNA-dihydrouridine synthase 3